MEGNENEASFRRKKGKEIERKQPITVLSKSSLDFSHLLKSLSEKDFFNEKQNFEISSNHHFDLNDSSQANHNKTVSNSIGRTKINCNLSLEQEKSMEGLLHSVDLSFLSNDFQLGDCNCFEQASQLVDPTLKDSESTPFSFNNNDLVQLFKFNFTNNNNNEDNLMNSSRNHDDLGKRKCISDKCEKSLAFKGDKGMCKDRRNLYHMFELLDTNMKNRKLQSENLQFPSRSSKEESTQKVRDGFSSKKKINIKEFRGPIKKGRRYMSNFKETVLEYAKNHTFKETASHFQINSNTITEWSRERSTERSPRKKKGIRSFVSDEANPKTDTNRAIKTEKFLSSGEITPETDFNEPDWRNGGEEESKKGKATKPEEKFLKWIEKKRLQGKELSRQEVFQMGKFYLKKYSSRCEKSSWFVSWLKRYNRILNRLNSNAETEKYIKYPVDFKSAVVLYAESFTKNSAARVFNVSRRRMFDWFNRFHLPNRKLGERNESDGMVDEIGGGGRGGGGEMKIRLKKDEVKNKIYSELHLWYQKMFFGGTRPTSNDIKEKAREIFSFHGAKEIKFSDGWLQKFCRRTNIKLRHSEDDPLLLWVLSQFDNNVTLSHREITEKSISLIGRKKFKGSKGWTLRFLKRHKNLLQRSPNFADQLPRLAQEKLNLFWEDFEMNMKRFKVEPENVGCMDEIPLNFTYPEEGKSSSMPLLRKTGFENCQGIVILSMLANGRFLPPAVVFKGTGPKQWLASQNLDLLILQEENGLVTVEVLKTWMNDIWLSFAPSPSGLVVDSFEPHRSMALNQLLTESNRFLHVIPDGCSSKFQPLDVEVTPSFKETIKNQWKELPVCSNSNSKSIQKYRCPDRDMILDWIKKACEEINRNSVSIINSFKRTGLLQ